MYERILIPLDGSKVGESALIHVENLISRMSSEVKVEVILLQVLSPIQPQLVSGQHLSDIEFSKHQIEDNTAKAIDYLTKTGEVLRSKGVTVEVRVSVGDVDTEIIKTANEIAANLIAISTHGRSGLARLAFGSVTDKVLRHSGNIPVLTVKAPKEALKG